MIENLKVVYMLAACLLVILITIFACIWMVLIVTDEISDRLASRRRARQINEYIEQHRNRR